MTIRFEGPAVLVADIDASRAFYADILAQEVLADHGPHVAFAGGFSIWQADHAITIIHPGTAKPPARLGHDNFELYFESHDLDGDFQRVAAHWEALIHPIEEAPWGQRAFRLHDPDGHVVEVGEPLTVLVRRLMDQGLTATQISERTSIPADAVAAMAGNADDDTTA
jgi:catechol 2,3-dioxygenase-like lactoylglutathione lyase family enzyme